MDGNSSFNEANKNVGEPQQSQINDQLYQKFSVDLAAHLLNDSFSGLEQKTIQIRVSYNEILNRLNAVNDFYTQANREFPISFKKSLIYFEKAINLKKELIQINEKCINFKKRAQELRRTSELNKTKTILQKQKEIEEEKRLVPVFNPSNSLLNKASPSSISIPKLSSLIPEDQASSSAPYPEPVMVTSMSKVSRVGKKVRQRAQPIEPQLEEDD